VNSAALHWSRQESLLLLLRHLLSPRPSQRPARACLWWTAASRCPSQRAKRPSLGAKTPTPAFPYGGEEGGVSRKHFRIMLVSGRYTVEDLDSTNFTLLNQAKLQPGAPMPLSDGDEIRAGRVKLTFKVGP